MPEARFDGQPVTYRQRCTGGDEARNDPNGFYHGMVVRYQGKEHVLAGPPLTLVPGPTEPVQADLFG